MNIQDIRKQLDEVNAKIEKLNFDENGNAIDREYTDELFALAEKLEEQLLGKSLTILTNI